MKKLFLQTSGIRIRIIGYSFRKALETEKNMLESFLHEGKKAYPQYFCETLGLTGLTDGLTDKVIRVKVKSSEGRNSFSNYTFSFKLQFNSLHQTC